MQKATQIVDRIAQEVDRMPSEWSWTGPLLTDFQKLQKELKQALSPEVGEDLSEFVSELKLCVITAAATKDMKKRFGNQYVPMLTLFIDRCKAVAQQMLNLASKIDNMSKAGNDQPPPGDSKTKATGKKKPKSKAKAKAVKQDEDA
ncbi:unnamed protein product [Symbiodinium microadriaticum]|nr:unnamed protein product [Symbiodinium microadriaticum]